MVNFSTISTELWMITDKLEIKRLDSVLKLRDSLEMIVKGSKTITTQCTTRRKLEGANNL